MMHLLLFCRLSERGRSIKACSRPIFQGTYPAIGECVHTRCKLLTEIQHFLYHPLSSIIGCFGFLGSRYIAFAMHLDICYV